MEFADYLGKFGAPQLRHDNIGDEHIDPSRIMFRHLNSILWVLRFKYFVSLRFEKLPNYLPNRELIFRQEHCLTEGGNLPTVSNHPPTRLKGMANPGPP